MAKLQIAFVLVLVCAALSCEAATRRVRPIRLIRSRQLARQEADVPVTPYPTADELKPEVPFEEAAPADEPAAEEVPAEPAAGEPVPDEVYGPPETALYTPDEIYGPPELDANQLPAEVALERLRKARIARLVQARRKAAYRQARIAKLRAAKRRTA